MPGTIETRLPYINYPATRMAINSDLQRKWETSTTSKY